MSYKVSDKKIYCATRYIQIPLSLDTTKKGLSAPFCYTYILQIIISSLYFLRQLFLPNT